MQTIIYLDIYMVVCQTCNLPASHDNRDEQFYCARGQGWAAGGAAAHSIKARCTRKLSNETHRQLSGP